MKLFLIAFALLLASSLTAQLPGTAQSSAGLPSNLDKLEGTWQCRNCDQTTWSTWSRQSDGILINRTYALLRPCLPSLGGQGGFGGQALVGLDTVHISHLEVSVREGKYTVLRVTRAGQPTEVFRLTRSARYELLWENENLASLQPTMYMNFYGSKRMVLNGSDASMDFRRKRQKAANVGFEKPATGLTLNGAHFVSAR